MLTIQLQIITILLCLSAIYSQTPSKECLDKFRKASAAAHDNYRKKHNVPVLKETSQLDNVAQKHAEQMARTSNFAHSSNGYGENIAYKGTSGNLDCAQLGEMFSKMWYDEIKQYNFNNPSFSFGTGHFTQVVWKDSKSVGFGLGLVSRGGMNYAYGVANYDPPGNFNNKYKENVLPPRK